MLQRTRILSWVLRTCLIILLLINLSNGFNITIPPQFNITVGDVRTFQWTWNSSTDQSSAGLAFVAMLIKIPDNDFNCSSIGVGGDSGTLYSIVESFAVLKPPAPGLGASGSLVLSPRSEGDHCICTYGNAPSNMVDWQQQSGDLSGNTIAKLLGNLNVLDRSDTFRVSPNSTAPSSSASPSTTDKNHSRWNQNVYPVAALVGGILGAVSLVLLVLVIIFYRRLRYQRKLNQFHKEHMLLQQQPPHSISLSSHTVTRLADPEAATVAPLSPISKKRSMTMQKGNSYQFISSDAIPQGSLSPPMYSAVLPNEPSSMYGYSDSSTETGKRDT